MAGGLEIDIKSQPDGIYERFDNFENELNVTATINGI